MTFWQTIRDGQVGKTTAESEDSGSAGKLKWKRRREPAREPTTEASK